MSRRLLSAVLVLLSGHAFAALPTHAERPPLDAFLSRTDSRPLPDARGFSPVGRAAWAAGHVSSTEPRYGVPTFFWSSRPAQGTRTFRAMGLSPEQAARRYLFAHAELYRGEPSRWAEARVTQVHDLHDGGAVIVGFQQTIDGVRVFRDELKVVMTPSLELVALAGYLTPEVKPLGAFHLSAESALAAAYQDLTGRGLEPQHLKAVDVKDGYQRFALEGESELARVRPTWFPVPNGLEPGLYVELDLAVGETDHDAYSFVVSAVDGRLLYRKNLTAFDAYTYRVWADSTALAMPMDGPQGNAGTPHQTGTPNGFDPGYVPQTTVTLQNGPISTNDPWLPTGATETNGNNAFAYVDAVRPNGYGTGDLVPTTTAANTFDRTYDTAQNPNVNADQRLAAATQLFYDVNFFHDWYYDVGFNEASGNAQLSNLGRGGAGGDQLRAEAQDYSGRNNANMSTPSDGASPRMQMYIFDGTSSGGVTLNTTPAQTLTVNVATFGPQAYNVTGEIVLVDDGSTSGGGTTSDGCSATFVNQVAGKIALIDRGVCTFLSKVQNAQANGALGVIIADNQTSSNPPTLSGSGSTTIPAVSVTRATGQSLRGMPAGTTVTLTRTATVDRDGTLDNAIVAHEWGHYISNRLIGDGNGISNLQAVGMGEGWGDFHAILLTVKAEDAMLPNNANWGGVYGMAGYTSFAQDPNGYYFGIRRVPYSTDMTKNGLTFKHIQDNVALPASVPTAFGQNGRSNSEVHNTGEVWATMLWECYAGLLRDPRLTFEQARDRMRGYLVAGYKATPLMPTFVDARDALLAVAAARDIADYAVLWTAFAKRGIGMLAVAPDRDAAGNRPVVESFDVGNALAITDVTLDDTVRSCDMDGQLDAREDGYLSITIKNIGVGMLTQSAVTVSSTTPAITFPDGPTVQVPATSPFAKVTVKVKVAAQDMIGITAGQFEVSVADPSLVVPGPVKRTALFRLNYDVKPNGTATDDVEAPTSLWTSASDPNGNTGSNWRIFQASATDHYWFGPNPASPADTWLISPTLSVGQQPFGITFKHRYDFEKDAQTGENYDGAVLEISTDDGATWTDIGAQAMPGYSGTLGAQGSNPLRGQRAYVGRSPGYPAFNTETVNLGRTYAGQSVRLRFRIGSDDAAAAKGWEVDDITFSGITNTPFTTVVGDPNTCTNRAPTATLGPDQEVNEGSQVTLAATVSDPDGDQVTQTWTQTSGPAVTIVSNGFTAPLVVADTPLTFELTVSDGRAVVGPFTHTVLVKNTNRAPTASLPAVIEVTEGNIVNVLGTGADPDGDVLTYEWTQVGGPAVTLDVSYGDRAGFVAPMVDADTIITLELVVRDLEVASAPARVEVVVKNKVETMTEEPVDPKKPGCGCTTGLDAGAAGLLALVALLRARRRR
ncbi:MAG: myxosortase-dependent M36 family metallopeptidase [Myxococcota bacterium]